MVRQEIIEDVSSYDFDNIKIKSKSRIGKYEFWKIRTTIKARVYIPLQECIINNVMLFSPKICKVSISTNDDFKKFLDSLNATCSLVTNKKITDNDDCFYIKSTAELEKQTKQLVDCVLCIEGVIILGNSFEILWSIEDFKSPQEYAAPDSIDIEEMKEELVWKINGFKEHSMKLVSHYKKKARKCDNLIGCLEICGHDVQEIENVRNQVNE